MEDKYAKLMEVCVLLITEWDDNEIGQIDGATIDELREAIEEVANG